MDRKRVLIDVLQAHPEGLRANEFYRRVLEELKRRGETVPKKTFWGYLGELQAEGIMEADRKGMLNVTYRLKSNPYESFVKQCCEMEELVRALLQLLTSELEEGLVESNDAAQDALSYRDFASFLILSARLKGKEHPSIKIWVEERAMESAELIFKEIDDFFEIAKQVVLTKMPFDMLLENLIHSMITFSPLNTRLAAKLRKYNEIEDIEGYGRGAQISHRAKDALLNFFAEQKS
jgi:hypothetical protein